MVRTDANWTGQDSEDQKCFSCVVVGFGEHVIDVVCSKQDVVPLSAPESEFYAMSSGGAQGIHTKNIIRDLQIDMSVRLETESTSVYGIDITQERAMVARPCCDVCEERKMKQISVRDTWHEIVSRSV